MARNGRDDLDADGQPNARFGRHRNLLKGVEALLGICRGLTADCELNEREILFLDTWLKDNAEVTAGWPGEVIAARVATILLDGVVTPAESQALCETLDQLIGGGLEDGITGGQSTELPLDRGSAIVFPGRSFCVTGAFLYGPRTKCHGAIEERGGRLAPVTFKLDYLVVGTMGSRDWKHSPFGLKILQAIDGRARGKSHVKIIGEHDWVNALARAPQQPVIV